MQHARPALTGHGHATPCSPNPTAACSSSAHPAARTLMPHTVTSSRVSSCSPNSSALPTSSTSVARRAGSPNSPGLGPDSLPPPPPRGESAPLHQRWQPRQRAGRGVGQVGQDAARREGATRTHWLDCWMTSRCHSTHAARGGRPPAAMFAMLVMPTAAAAAAAPPPNTGRRCALLLPLVPPPPLPRPSGSKKGGGVARERAQALPGPRGFIVGRLLAAGRAADGWAGWSGERL